MVTGKADDFSSESGILLGRSRLDFRFVAVVTFFDEGRVEHLRISLSHPN